MAEPTQWALNLADDLFIAAGDAARGQASGDDLGASIDRLGCRLLYLKDAFPAALDAARQQGYREATTAAAEHLEERASCFPLAPIFNGRVMRDELLTNAIIIRTLTPEDKTP